VFGVGQSEEPEPECYGGSDPMREAGAANRRKLLLRFGQFCARPTGYIHGRTIDAPEQRFNGANLRATLEVG
jgi:hypothetical protein